MAGNLITMSNAHRNQGPSAWRIHHVVKIPIPMAVSSTHQHLHQHRHEPSASASASASSPTPPIATTTTMGVLMIATSSRENDDHVTDGTSDYLLVLQVMTGAYRNNNDGLFRAILTEVDIRQAYKGKATTFAATTAVTSKSDQENKMLPPLFQQVVSWLLLSSLDLSSPSSATTTQLASTHHPPDLSPAMQAQWTWIDNNTNNTDIDIDIDSEEAPIGRSLHLQVMERLQNGIVLKPWSVTLLSSQHSDHRHNSSSNNNTWDSFWLPFVDYQHCLLQQLQQQKHEAQLWLQARDEWQDTALILQGAWEDEKSILIRNFLTLYQTQQTVCQKLHQQVRELQAELQHHGQRQLEQQHEKRHARRRNVQDNDDKDHDDLHGNIWNNLPKDNEQDELFDAETVARLAAGQKLHPIVGGQLPQSTLIHSPATTTTKTTTTTGAGRRQIRNGGGDRSQSNNQSNDKNGTKEQVHTFLKQEEDEDEQQQQKRQQHLNESADPNKSNPSTNPIDEQPYHNAKSKHVMWANDGNKSEMDHGRESKTSTIRNDSANSDLENNMALPDKAMTETAKKKLSLAWDGTLDGDDDDDDLFDWKRSPKSNLVSAAADTTIHHSRNSASQSLILETPATKNKPASTATNQMPTTDRTSSVMPDIEKSAPRPSLRQFLDVDDDNDDDLEFIKHRRAPIVAELPLQTTQPLRHAEGGSNVGTANKKTATRKQWSMDDDDDAINNKNNNVTNNVTSAGTTVANVRQLPAKRSFLDSDTDDDDDSNLLIPKRKKRPQE